MDREDGERPDGSDDNINLSPKSDGGDPPFPLTLAEAVLLERNKWPEWFGDLVAYLEGYDHGTQWKDVLGCLMVWEGRGGFKDLKGAKHGLPPTGRPMEVGPWIKNYRWTKPEVTAETLRRFANDWWTWWKRFQPTWQNTGDMEGPLTSDHQPGLGGDWSSLVKRGQNGFMSPVACLAWWGEAVGDETELRMEWEGALEECHHVLLNLLASQS
ncbi:hypothetical protein EV421DRAFT_1713175 [Armillaria borealis]|uniref:Uncharacterized protein n=1 Tax=Armillaria borealis TaxID=47425 RepID=A0AA39JBD1_9AGAR|nr:hypothetical protein EV421DRAFT_1713175 [Armillaria borealis]